MKVFGIGFQRTGTGSLNDALNLLGIRSVHNPRPLFGDPSSDLLDRFDGFTDNPIPLIYPALDARFPGSRFIFTDRAVDRWLESVAWLFSAGRRRNRWDRKPEVDRIHAALYGTSAFDATRFRERFLRHREEVRACFRDRPGDLLVLDLDAGLDWGPLCAFLGKPVPAVPFPCRHRRGGAAGTPDGPAPAGATVPDGTAPHDPPAGGCRIFGVGLPRTGGVLLRLALEGLGVRTRSFPSELLQDPGAPPAAGFQGLVEYPVSRLFRELDAREPGARFILTDPDVERWLEGVRRNVESAGGEFLRKAAWEDHFGGGPFEPGRFRERFLAHREAVRAWFAGRPGDLLVTDLSLGGGWGPLCAFLGVPGPRVPFPRPPGRDAG